MDEGRLILERRIRKDLELLERLWRELGTVDLAAPEIDEKEIVACRAAPELGAAIRR